MTEEAPTFGVVNYIMLALTVAVSLAVGVYHSVRGNKTAEDYAMGSRNMNPLPVSLSLMASFMSAAGILGISGEVYGHGIGLVWSIPATILAVIFAAEIVVPVLYPLKLDTPNQYLEIRFQSPWLRRLAMGMSFMSIIVFMGLALYAPTLALAAVTPLSFYTYIWIMGIAVTIYASFGGLKAVVWTDVFQMVLMLSGVLLVSVMACIDAGGLGNVWRIAAEGGRTGGSNIDASPYTRHSVWNVTLMVAVNWGSHYSVSQTNHQRISSVSTINKAKRVLYYNLSGSCIFSALMFFMGLCIYSVYAGCDPYAKGLISRTDQIAPYYVNDRMSHLAGIPGIFVAMLLSAALSTLSSGVNVLATLFWSDIFSQMPCFKGASDFTAATVSKLIGVCVGALTIGLAFLASQMGGLIQAGYTIMGVMTGPFLGVFLLGMAVPFSNKIGGFIGLISGWGLSVWIAMGGLLYPRSSSLLPFSTVNCSDVVASLTQNVTSLIVTATTTIPDTGSQNTTGPVCSVGDAAGCVSRGTSSGWSYLYTISYTYYPFIGLSTCLIVGTIASLLTGYQDPKKVPSKLVFVCLRRFTAKDRELEGEDDPESVSLRIRDC